MGDNKKHQNNNSLDLVEPFLHLFNEVFKLIFMLAQMLIEFLFQKGKVWYLEKRKGGYYNRPITQKEIHSKKQVEAIEHLGYSINRRRPFRFGEIDSKRHTAVIGSTGSGKSVCLENLMLNSLLQDKPIIYFDPKPSFGSIKKFKALCRYFNKEAYVISDIEPTPALFNPLLEGNAHEITNRIMSALEWSEPYYKIESQRVLFETIRQIEREQIPLTFIEIIIVLGSHKDRKSISGLLSQLSSISNSEYAEILNSTPQTSLSYRRIRTEGACVYIGISSLGMGSVGMAINKLFFGGLLFHSKESFNGVIPGLQDPLTKPISIFFDELASIAHEGFIDLQNKCRAAGIEITFATQCPSDLDRISPEMTLQVFENTNNIFVFNQIVPAHTEFFAKLAGTTTVLKKTYATEDGNRSDNGSEREVEEFIAHANLFRGLRVGQCIFIQRTPKRIDLINVRLLNLKEESICKPQAKLQSAF